jgi:GTPase SAR1 family protein
VKDWLEDLRNIADKDIVVILVGNKSDLASSEKENKREVTIQEAEEWARVNGVLEYVETSAKSGRGVELAFGRVHLAGWQREYTRISKLESMI